MKRLALLSASLLLSLVGCASSTTFRVVDVDHGYQPIANATIARYQTPRRPTDPWPSTPVEQKSTHSDGTITFDDNRGRFLISAPGKATTSFYSTFASHRMEIGLSSTSAPAR